MKKLLLSFIFMALLGKLSASHIVGGDITVKYISGNNYEVTLKLYVDCINGKIDFDPSGIQLGVFDRVTHGKLMEFHMDTISSRRLKLGDSCYIPPNLCVEEGVYKTIISLPNNPNGYYITWQRCCRNGIINNIVGPGDAAMVFYAEVPDPALVNSTPVFGGYPKAYMCVNQPNIESFACTDADGDSIVYSLITPLNGDANKTVVGQYPGTTVVTSGPYSTITWKAPYHAGDMVGGPPIMSIDPKTGLLVAYPNQLGVYVFAVRVEEFRNGIKIGEIRRDIQYQVLPCNGNNPPVFTSPTTASTISYTITAGDTLCFPIVLNDPNTSDSITITASGELLNNPDFASVTFTPVYGHKTGTTQLCAISSCESIRDTPYKVRFTGEDFSCYGNNTITLDVDVLVKPNVEGNVKHVPNVFTPNGDGKNDLFKLQTQADFCSNEFGIKVYDRWGLLVYESEELGFTWDGKFRKNGKDLTQGVYYYIITASFRTSSFAQHGFVHLLR